ncbi:hypothetical protein R1CP_39945 (plasmid) [Rhodococcus opacus]|uniref:Uncharacterized protein n=1 Tax=Rhodococcus opacus TaxID=37919 RepID=A0A1B1KJ00_RHOOP|nr:hypothetical protein [Rhodococcus opacus]ANS32570.1 hypothetical protein R1CP_39945 [Rhodococcus opacus]
MAIVVIAGVASLNRRGQAAVTRYLAAGDKIWTYRHRRGWAK